MTTTTTTQHEWTPTNLEGGIYLGVIEFKDIQGEWHQFEVMQAAVPSDRIAFGGACNVGFLESGFIRREDGESTEDTLQEMLSELETYYGVGPDYCNRIVFNDRM